MEETSTNKEVVLFSAVYKNEKVLHTYTSTHIHTPNDHQHKKNNFKRKDTASMAKNGCI